MDNDELRILVENGLKRHALVDQCFCNDCVRDYGPEGAPGRCGHCRDSEQGVVCADRSTYLNVRDLLDEADRVIPAHRDKEDCPYCAKQFCPNCDRVVRYRINPSNPPTHCPKCGQRDRLELRGVKHVNRGIAADHRMTYRLEQRTTPPIFCRLPDGSWGVKGSRLVEGEEVLVARRDGEEVSVVIGQIMDTDEYGSSVARIARKSWDA